MTTAPAPRACTWPACLTPAQQAELADQVTASMLGEPTTPGPDQRPICGCREPHACGNCEGVDPETCLLNPDRREPDNETATALARHIASHPVGVVQAAYRLLGMELAFEVRDDTTAPGGDGQAAATPDPGSLRERITAALRAAAHSCDGACGLDERTCHDAHPVQEAATTHGVISDLYGPIAAIADVVAGVRGAEMERLRVERDDALAVADADSKQLAEVDVRCDTAAAELRAVRAELDRIAELPTVTSDDGRADRFSTGARWTLRMIREVLNGVTHPAATGDHQ